MTDWEVCFHDRETLPLNMLAAPSSAFISAPDGLRLHSRCHGRRSAQALPVLCLPGLARTAADFDALAEALANDPKQPRRVVALDYRGRGLSDYDRDPANYSFQTEIADVLAVATALECLPAVIVGTSRGGILAMLLAALRPGAIAGCVLNDIGPVIEPKGLVRIKGYVGKLPQPASFEDGAVILRRLFDPSFQSSRITIGSPPRTARSKRRTAGWCRPTTSSSPRPWKASISKGRCPRCGRSSTRLPTCR